MATVTQKKVNVVSRTPISGLSTKSSLVGIVNGIVLSVNDILVCLRAKAKVVEIIGVRRIPLDFANYNIDNTVIPTAVKPAQPTVMDVKVVNGKLAVDKTQTATPVAPKVNVVPPVQAAQTASTPTTATTKPTVTNVHAAEESAPATAATPVTPVTPAATPAAAPATPVTPTVTPAATATTTTATKA